MRIALLFAVALLAGCASTPQPAAPERFAWVQLGADGALQARAAVAKGTPCPALDVDGRALPMAARTPADDGTSALARRRIVFDVTVCEAALPKDAARVALDGQRLPTGSAAPRRIVVLGDTGCRIVQGLVQKCNDADDWPFAKVAAAAAATQPDLVIHVGDYHYRERPCPADEKGCAGSPWGYGWDVWRADLFAPAAPLLAAAPWVFTRGNHEECSRAGQGWWRLIGPGPYDRHRNCDEPARDEAGDFAAPYAVPAGPGLQLIVFDSALAGYNRFDPAKPRERHAREAYLDEARAVAALAAKPGTQSWFVSHHPILGFAPSRASADAPPVAGNPALQELLAIVNGPSYFPAGVQLALHGHIHLFEALVFASGQPPTVVAGNAGDWRDRDLPRVQDISAWEPAPGARLAQIVHSNSFGFLLMEREGEAWQITALDLAGRPIARCRLGPGRSMSCS